MGFSAKLPKIGKFGAAAVFAAVLAAVGLEFMANASAIGDKWPLIWKVADSPSQGSARGGGASLNKTFGFQVASRGGIVTGQLTYHDGDFGFDLKSLIIDSLIIDGNHASFSGQARLRTPGQPDEIVDFSVEVVDNGEPGDVDTFRIDWVASAGSYTFNSTVMRGNIQVRSG